MAQATLRAKASRTQKYRDQRKSYQSTYDDDYCAIYPAIKGLLARGDCVADIAAHLRVDPDYVAAIADETIRIQDVNALDMTLYPALPCSRLSDVGAALDCLDAASRALDVADVSETTHHLTALRKLLESYQLYWKQ